ncbi:MAG: tryptophan--tRNA ligase, partial [Ruminococcaceae bacterium]|nr:tryptophan--tRNA ligase [Oscillospiraceae bacterium]
DRQYLYQPDYVPVGEDQRQHLEIARDIAGRFNGNFGNVFKIPEAYIGKHGARVMSLANPEKKMSKSDANTNSFISILDAPNIIMKKFKRAVTDSEAKVRYAEGKDGINNLMGIYSCTTGKSFDEIEDEFTGKGYGDFKVAVAESVIAELEPVQQRFKELMEDRAYLKECYRAGDERARRMSARTLLKAMKKMGFIVE